MTDTNRLSQELRQAWICLRRQEEAAEVLECQRDKLVEALRACLPYVTLALEQQMPAKLCDIRRACDVEKRAKEVLSAHEEEGP